MIRACGGVWADADAHGASDARLPCDHGARTDGAPRAPARGCRSVHSRKGGTGRGGRWRRRLGARAERRGWPWRLSLRRRALQSCLLRGRNRGQSLRRRGSARPGGRLPCLRPGDERAMWLEALLPAEHRRLVLERLDLQGARRLRSHGLPRRTLTSWSTSASGSGSPTGRARPSRGAPRWQWACAARPRRATGRTTTR